ncbi:GtrA family protein [Blautia sp.]|uniref:GtrA family protein n=1 Tax=Blautia sp. TaxID=1955243 RepID=UPI00280AD942|nr:GtrA family protein [Blautia sp.]MDY3015661.1 GtrA family protein [Blautia sp.]MED9882285.1 GtrA family protein [Blautia sp.]
MDKLKKIIARFYGNDVIRYVFFGGCTTLVNLVCFYVLRKLKVQLTAANVISIITAILFAYVVNSKFVFQDKCKTIKDHVQPFIKFISARLVTMIIEVGGVWLLVEIMHMNDMLGKFVTQFIVLALNYIFSKFFVFTTGR